MLRPNLRCSMHNPSRREFLKSSIATAVASELSASLPASSLVADAATLPIKKGVLLDMLPSKLSYADRFKLARDVGFDVVQAPTTPDQHEAEEIQKAASSSGIR